MRNDIHFATPPLNEVVLGIHFTGINWTINHYGQYYATIAGNYPKSHSVAPLAPPFQGPTSQFTILTAPALPRVWYESTDPTYLIQVQPDRFMFNWRDLGTSTYPHFDFFLKRFQDEYKKFNDFTKGAGLGTPAVVHYELTYVNHLVHGTHWKEPRDLSLLFKHLGCCENFEGIEGFGLDVFYKAGDFKIRHSLKRATRSTDNKSLFIADLSVVERVKPGGSFEERAKLANETLVNEFVRITTDKAKSEWGYNGE